MRCDGVGDDSGDVDGCHDAGFGLGWVGLYKHDL